MIKNSVSVQDVCVLLNQLLEIDPECINNLFLYHTTCNEKVIDHPTVQVQQNVGSIKVGFLGILNGLFGVREDNMGPICMEIKNSRIIRFKLTPSSGSK